MFKLPWHLLSPIALLSLPLAAGAAPPDALDASAPVPPAVHESAFKRYRPHADANVRDWKSTNATVARIGGWRAYAREAHAPASVPAPARPAGVDQSGQPQGKEP